MQYLDFLKSKIGELLIWYERVSHLSKIRPVPGAVCHAV